MGHGWVFNTPDKEVGGGGASESPESAVQITYTNHHFSTIRKDTGWCIYPHSVCIHPSNKGNRVHRLKKEYQKYPLINNDWQIISIQTQLWKGFCMLFWVWPKRCTIFHIHIYTHAAILWSVPGLQRCQMEQRWLIGYSPFIGVHTFTGSCVQFKSVNCPTIIENSNICINQ